MNRKQITPKPETITPAKAERWLNTNSNNRKLRPGVAERYAEDMKAGKWTMCAAPIWFYADGALADGQHRLFAIVESQTTQVMLVGRGLSKEDGFNIDTGATRTLVDAARISGQDITLNNHLIALARGVEEGDKALRNASHALKYSYVVKHREAATFAQTHQAKGKRFSNAIIGAAIARAWYHEKDKERLVAFSNVLSTGFPEGAGDEAAIALRNAILSATVHAGVDKNSWRDIFFKTQNAIWHFMRKKPLVVIRRVNEEKYPLPKGGKTS